VNFSGNLFRVIDLEESTDKETIHLLIHLLMQFMSRPDLAYPTDEKPTARLMQIVLKHVYLLMGFNQNEKMFQFSSGRIRCSSVFNGFMANLPQFMDQNHEMGAADTLFNFIIQLLIYSPYPNNSIPATFEVMQNTSYSLWFLEIQVRRNWLMAVLVILYKYNLSTIPEPFLTSIIRIVMNSLEGQFHQCRRIPTTILVQDLPRRPETDDRDQISQSQMKPPSQLRKLHDSSIECDETESELVAIPESDLSDSTLQGSIDGGMSDDLAPLKSDIKKKKSDYHEEVKKAPKILSKSQSVETTKSLSEGVRMMFSSAILSPPVNVQKAIVVTQSSSIRPIQSTSKDTCVSASQMMANVSRTVSAVAGEKQKMIVTPQTGNGSYTSRRSTSPVPRALGRQQRIIDTNGIQHPSTSSLDEHKKPQSAYIRSIERKNNYYGSPESPLSRMDIMSPPGTDVSTDGTETLLSPSSVKQLEIPTPERLLPIGNMGKESVSSLVDRVREALSIPDISHLKSQDHLDSCVETSPPNSSRAMSPRKLIKQVALIESPPSANAAEFLVKRSEGKNELNARDEKRQTFQKVGPYQSTDGRLRYAGSWAPPSHNDEDYDEEDEASARATSYVSIDTKPVRFLSSQIYFKLNELSPNRVLSESVTIVSTIDAASAAP
jgi:protein unc-79